MRTDGSAVDHLDVAITRGGDRIHHPIPDARFPPSHEAPVAGGARAVALRQAAPRRTRTQHPEDAVQHTPVIDARHASWFVGQQRLNYAPFEFGQVISAHVTAESEKYEPRKAASLRLPRATRIRYKLRMRTLLTAMVILAFAGCASPQVRPKISVPVVTLKARLISSAEISVFSGDVAEVGYSYRFERLTVPRKIFVAVAWERCPADNQHEQLYELQVQRQKLAIGLGTGQSDSPASNLTIISCKAL